MQAQSQAVQVTPPSADDTVANGCDQGSASSKHVDVSAKMTEALHRFVQKNRDILEALAK
jgi:hypothetical protein